MAKIYLLNNKKYEGVENIEIFKIEYIPSSIKIEDYDALVFTSKNAIYSIASFNNQWKKIPSYAIAPMTAKIIEEEGGSLEFVGNSSHGDEFALELLEPLKNKKALYIRAQKVASNLSTILKDKKIDIEEIITYKTVCNDNINTKIEDNSVVIFSSPSTIKCFFKKYSWNDTLKAVVIGKTTAKHLPEGIDFSISSKTSIEECIKLARCLLFNV